MPGGVVYGQHVNRVRNLVSGTKLLHLRLCVHGSPQVVLFALAVSISPLDPGLSQHRPNTWQIFVNQASAVTYSK